MQVVLQEMEQDRHVLDLVANQADEIAEVQEVMGMKLQNEDQQDLIHAVDNILKYYKKGPRQSR